MRQIGFENFRKFEVFPDMDLAPITILVGENNAGKSTVVKGILAISDFINGKKYLEIEPLLSRYDQYEASRLEVNKKYLENIRFYFNTSYLAHIGTFKRAIYNKAKNNCITFNADLILYKVSIIVEGNKDDEEAVSARVISIKVNVPYCNIDMEFDILNDKATITFNTESNGDLSRMSQRFQESIAKYFSKINEAVSITTTITSNWSPYRSNIILSLIESIELSITSTLYHHLNGNKNKKEDNIPGYHYNPISNISPKDIDFLLSIYGDKANKDSLFRFKLPGLNVISSSALNIEYLYAHAVTQTVIYSAKDNNDYLSRTVHEFAPFQKNKRKRLFIINWMKEFGIGTDFSIKSIGGEAHIVYITNSDGEKVNLADKGMGSIQLMVLLFRLAITIPLHRLSLVKGGILKNNVIIIEEPEQNLHPMLQSKLADLFYELNRDYDFKFIMETHSEYLIRKTQVIVSEKYNNEEKIEENPFKVYYFPSEGIPYEVRYRTNGRFENDFGKGFFDEAANLSFKLF
jgi:predicted ATPase